MVSEDEIKDLFQNGVKNLPEHIEPSNTVITEIYRGRTPHMDNQPPGGCNRHLFLFEHFKIIPKNCFNCYKVQVEPRTVVELFKLMDIFNNIRFSNNNRRKCMVEGREKVSGTYKGLIYCDGLEEGKAVLKETQAEISKELSEDISVNLKHGCSEYSLEYPEYGQIDQEQPMAYKEEWQMYEDLSDKKLVVNETPLPDEEFDQQGYSQNDYLAMQIWLRYAATIGDLSYLKISGETVGPLIGLNRTPFSPVL